MIYLFYPFIANKESKDLFIDQSNKLPVASDETYLTVIEYCAWVYFSASIQPLS